MPSLSVDEVWIACPTSLVRPSYIQYAPAVINSAESGKQHGTAVHYRPVVRNINNGRLRFAGMAHAHMVDHSTSDLRWYFGSSPQPSWWARRGLLGPARPSTSSLPPSLGRYHVTEQCLTSGCARPGRGPFPGSHPHTSITTSTSTSTSILPSPTTIRYHHHLRQIPICSPHRNCGWSHITKTMTNKQTCAVY